DALVKQFVECTKADVTINNLMSRARSVKAPTAKKEKDSPGQALTTEAAIDEQDFVGPDDSDTEAEDAGDEAQGKSDILIPALPHCSQQ
ncbi:HMCN1, partial [Symbiodinium sp. CCMP2456]